MVPIFDGWFCFGGTEIINNARAVGYARTASQIANAETPDSGGESELVVATNEMVNPSFEGFGLGAVEVRRNLIRYSDLSTTTGWTPTGGTMASDAVRLRYTANGGSAIRLGGTTTLLAAKPAGAYVASMRAQAMSANLTGVRIYLYDSASSTIRAQQSIPMANVGSPARYEFSLTATGVFDIVYMEFYGTAIVSGDIGFISEPLLESGTVQRQFFNGDARPKSRRNLALNPRGVGAGGTGWQSNSAVTHPITRGVTPPVPHPLGIATAVEQSSNGTNSALATMYNIDSLLNTGTPARAIGAWVLVTEPGYSSYGVSLPANQWVFVRHTAITAAGTYGQFYVNKDTGFSSTTARVYITGLVVEERAVPVGDYFDGNIVPAGYVGVWEGAALTSASYLMDADFTTNWTAAVDASESRLMADSVGAVTPGGTLAFRSVRWKSTGNVSMRVRPTGVLGSTYVILRSITAADAGKTFRMLIKVNVESPISATAAYARSLFITTNGTPNNQQGPQVPNVPGEYTLDWTVTIPADTTAGTIRFYHGGPAGDPDLWVDDFAMVQAPYGGGFFYGDTPNGDGFIYRWTAGVNTSTSQMVIPATSPTDNYCDINWFSWEGEECRQNLFTALDEEVAYESRFIPDEAPWYSAASGYDTVYTPARKFLGAFALSVSSLSDSTRTVGITEGILSGGVLGRERLAVPRFRFRVMLTAVDEEGLEYGKAWLSKAISEQSCSTHGPSCGSSDLTFLAACPPGRAPGTPDPVFDEKFQSLSRMYHDVKCIEGPITTDQFKRGENSWGAIVEFTLAAGVPNMFGVAPPFLPIDQAGETIVQDIPLNFIPYPSAEIAGADVTAATNYSLNPSLESNATGWATASVAVTGTAPASRITSARVTGELSAAGTSSYRARLLGDGVAASGRARVTAIQSVDISARPAGANVSVTIWGAVVNVGPATTIYSLTGGIDWYTAGNVFISTTPLTPGSGGLGGNTFSSRSLVPPPTAAQARAFVRAEFDWVSGGTNSDVRLYADALAVTVP